MVGSTNYVKCGGGVIGDMLEVLPPWLVYLAVGGIVAAESAFVAGLVLPAVCRNTLTAIWISQGGCVPWRAARMRLGRETR